MEQRPLGPTGIDVSVLCLGTRNFGNVTRKRAARKILQRALEAGLNFFDTSPRYQATLAEKILGKALKKVRDQVVIATKVFVHPDRAVPGTIRAHVVAACEASLKRLRTDRIDLYQLHRPVWGVPQEEVLAAFDELVRAGKVLHIGSSTHPAEMIEEAAGIARDRGFAPYVSEQPPYNLLDRDVENGVLDACRRERMAVLPWSPLAGGMLAGRYRAGEPLPADSRAAGTPHYRQWMSDQALRVSAQVAGIAVARGLQPAQLALLWVKDRPGVTSALLGPRTMEHLDAALAVVDQRLDDDTLAALDAVAPPGSTVVDFHTPVMTGNPSTRGTPPHPTLPPHPSNATLRADPRS